MQNLTKKLRQYNYLMNEINSLYHELAVKSGISDSIQIILYIICENEGKCLQSELYKQSGISRQTINSAIRRLERDNIVQLTKGQGRNTVVSLTEYGKTFADGKISPLYNIENEIFSEWTEAELNQYLVLTQKYRDVLKEKIENFGG